MFNPETRNLSPEEMGIKPEEMSIKKPEEVKEEEKDSKLKKAMDSLEKGDYDNAYILSTRLKNPAEITEMAQRFRGKHNDYAERLAQKAEKLEKMQRMFGKK